MSFRQSLFAMILAALTVLSASLHAAEPASSPDLLVRSAGNLYSGLQMETLPNGLRVYLLPVPGAATVSTMVAYRVGSGDEEKDQTGLSHYLEHLLFKGTDKLMPGDIDRATQRNGGHNNAYTSEDMTVYHFDFASDRWTTALDIEADRMRNVRIDARHEFEQEKGAVIAELDGGEDGPWDLESKAILPILFAKEAPYSHPVIGDKAHVRGATAEIIKRHYDKWYHPNNASLVIVGGFDSVDAMARIRKQLGVIPSFDLPKRKPVPTTAKRTAQVRKEFASKFEVPRLMIGFNTVAVGHADDPVLDFVETILSSGKTSRLYRKLVEDERIASGVNAGNQAGRYPGWFSVHVELLKGKDRQRAEELAFAEIEKLANEPVSDAELARARKKILARMLFARESVHDLANSIAVTATYPGGENVPAFHRDNIERLSAVTKADIQRAARAYLARSSAAIVWSVPKDEKAGASAPTRGDSSRSRSRSNANAGPTPGGGASSLTKARRTVLPNGLTLITLEDHRLPIVYSRAEVRDIRLREPADKAGIASLVGDLLEEGTNAHTGKEISKLIEDSGGSLSLGAQGGACQVLTPDTDLGLGLFFECLTKPTFPQSEFDRVREQQLSAIEEADADPQARATNLFHAMVYGPHPFGRSALGTQDTVKKLTPQDCKAFHAQTFVPQQAVVVVVGDFATDDLIAKVTALTKDWKRAELEKLSYAAPEKATAVTQKFVSDPNAAQVHLHIGQLGITRKHPDYYKLLVMDNVLGVGPGFTDRLSANLRDRQGLAYTVRATITASAGTQPGTFLGYVGTFPDKLLWVRDGFLKEVNRLRDEAPTDTEVDDAKKYLLGSLPFRFSTLGSVASQLLEAERYSLGFDFLETYRREVAKVTPADVQSMARQHIDPKTLSIIAVGPVDEQGRALVKPKKE